MPVHTAEIRHLAIKTALMRGVGSGQKARAASLVTLQMLDRVTICLAPVLGVKGVEMLIRRAIYISSQRFPWMANAIASENGGTQLVSLGSGLDACTPDTAGEASYTLLVTFTDQLANLIGESLTSQLLQPVWSET